MLTEFIKSIGDGEFDESLPLIEVAIRQRKRTKDLVEFGGVEVGDVIEFNERCSPKYLQGARGTVQDVLRYDRKVVVDLSAPVYGNRNRYGDRKKWQYGIKVPLGIFRKVVV